MTSLEAWERLRGEQRLGPERALATVETAALALALAATLEPARDRPPAEREEARDDARPA